MKTFENISYRQNLAFENTENDCFCDFQNVDYQYWYCYDFSSTFTGKEKDPLRLYLQSGELCRARLTSPLDLLTGYSYFGARYLDHELMTTWLSVDPMSDKYPSISPYAYCAWNPVKLVDPEGSEIGDYYTRDGKWLGHDKNINDNKVYICDGLDENNCAINKNVLLITHKQFREKAATVYGESSAYRYSGNTVPDDLKCEMFAIASVLERNKNAYGAKSKKANDFLKDTPEQNNKNNFRVTANAAVINALTGGFDYSYGATQWDGMEQALYPETENSSHLNGYELHMNTMGWTIPDKLYEKWKNNVGKGFKAPQEKEAVAGRNKGRKRLTAKAVYCRTIFWKSS